MLKINRMIKTILTVVFCLSITSMVIGQNKNLIKAQQTLNERGEVYFQFQLDEQKPIRDQLDKLTRIVSIDNVDNLTVTAYANKRSFEIFRTLAIDFELLTPPSMLHQPRMLGARDVHSRTDWDFYPTYFGYVDIMDQFADDYPDLCEVISIATLPSERQILLIHINDSLGVDQNEPEFLYTSTMHGNEVTGYVLSLHLIEYLLENYGSDEQVTNLVNNIDIWINPLANPDGTYAGGNNSVFGATRGNANGIDLNRNFPDPEDGPHPDGYDWQPETEAFMEFAEDHDFVMSANFHDGAEVCNYPWDTWWKRHPDDDWWIYVCRQWADTVHFYAPNGYFDDLDNGITNGYDWYSIAGGRQDYMNYFHHCREFTLEISGNQIPPANQLPAFWDYQHRSMLNYMEQVLFGVRGKVTNALNGNPVPAKVYIEDHDEDESHVYATLPVGNYHRPIKEGTYDFTFSLLGYYPETIENVSPEDMETLLLDVELQPYFNLTADFFASDTIVEAGDTVNFTDMSSGNNIITWEWTFDGGEPSTSDEQNPSGIAYNEKGAYDVSLTITNDEGGSNSLTRIDYILATEGYSMKDTTIYLCDGLFYDSGGRDANYSDDEDYTITFVSLYESGMLEVVFFDFEIEDDGNCSYDYLEAFDGMDVNAPLIGKWCGTEIPNSITANNIDGALTFRFHSNEAINFPGWKAFVTCDTSVGIVETENDNLKVFPNPAHEILTILSSEIIEKITVYNMTGMEVYNSKLPSKEVNINVKTFKPGVYIAIIESNSNSWSRKLIIY